ncbi:conserved hypothetical protein [Perkinsus marinus ATCC 50983]|uniref:Uncharacterized protein n=1 Tax=Perkinsus marinus (strain ATCC 50983 / TXsc) TaxID=423536 RepID=C5KU28_PERM5|nr:conserved hypothetical protein [Perkinsus marinus ATCC 50983]EER12070.1 conserved hypothetical protein [Perkinsus marinus ATCC 50983]|eukprot:XP_002780275.1 conserved hypothetical protein [Perkinsus marinus ATCC 50983]
MVFTQTVDFTWNGEHRDDLTENQKPVEFAVKYDCVTQEFIVKVRAPFFNDCRIPPSKGETGYGTYELWNYEVAEIFIQGKDSHYTEIELSPFGNFLILTFEAPRKATNDDVCLSVPPSTDIVDGHWMSTLRLPKKFLAAPRENSKSMFSFNCYHIHGEEEERKYFAAFPDDTGDEVTPDFHRLQYFKDLPDDAVFGAEGIKQLRA